MIRRSRFNKTLALILSLAMVVSMFPASVFATEGEAKAAPIVVNSAEELPQAVNAGEVVELGSDITLKPGQQIATVAGTLDGKGHTITIADKALIGEVTGTVQNLGVAGTGVIAGSQFGNTFGTIADKLNKGTILNSFSTADIKDQFNDAGCLVGESVGGTIRNSFHAGKAEGSMYGGLIGVSVTAEAPSVITDCYYVYGQTPVSQGLQYNKAEGRFGKKTLDEMKSQDFVTLLNKDIQDTGFNWKAVEGNLPELAAVKPAGNVILSAEDLPQVINEGETYELGADITLNPGQQIATVAGTLDGKGHTITLADKVLTGEVTGTVQNIIIKGSLKKSGDYTGTLVDFLNGGTIRNAGSLVDLELAFFGADGGIVGKSESGKVYNSYYGGTVTGTAADVAGIIGQSNQSGKESEIKNCYYTGTKDKPVNFGNAYNENDPSYAKKTAEELKGAAVVALLNKDSQNTGFTWQVVEGQFPELVVNEGPGPVPGETDKSVLIARIAEVRAMDKEGFTKDTWALVEEALTKADAVVANGETDQAAVEDALKTLNESVAGLKVVLPVKAVKIPEDEVITIKSGTDFLDMGDTTGKYYRLENDIKVKFDIMQSFDHVGVFNGVLDGAGHTIEFAEGHNGGLFKSIGATGVVQNVHFKGTLNDAGPLGDRLYGAVINCSSEIKGTEASGIVKRLAGGVISNVISYGKPGKGALAKEYGTTNWDDGSLFTGKIYNSYWLAGPKDPVINSEDLLDGSAVKTEKELKTKEIVKALNAKTGEYGTAWGQNGVTGLPYFGPDQDYDPEKIVLPDSKYEVIFGKTRDTATPVKEKRLDVSLNDLTATDNSIIGQFFIEGVDPDTVTWDIKDVKNNSLDINKGNISKEDGGKLHVFADGEAVVVGKVNGVDSVWVKVFSSSKVIEDFKLYIDGTDITDKSVTVFGSEGKVIKIKAKYQGSSEYVDTYSGKFEFNYEDNSKVKNEKGPYFEFTAPGKSNVNVNPKGSKVKHSIQITSEYVPIESVRPDTSPMYYIHARASMGDGYMFDAIENNGVVISPSNASTKKGFNVTSDNESVVKFTPTLPVGYLPFGPGKATLEATITDVNPNGESRVVKGSSTVEFKYKNPLTDVKVNTPEITVDEYKVAPLDLTFTGELSKDGWSITEPGFDWTFEGDGKVEIFREKPMLQNRNDSLPMDKGMWMASTDYQVKGIKAGTVVATGTPVDKTNNVAPVKITFTVNPGEVPDLDIPGFIEDGTRDALNFINSKYADKDFKHGNEWEIYELLRRGDSVSEEKLNKYYDSVVKTVGTWNKNVKPTDVERTILALNAMEKDITDVGGVNLPELVYNSPKLKQGSNELCWALIALDSADTEIPETATWNRDKIVAELLTWQNADGGFPLFAKGGSEIDTTAMVVQGLANYTEKPEVKAAIDEAVKYMSDKVKPKFDSGSSEANAQIIITLSVLGIDAVTDENFNSGIEGVVPALMNYHEEGKGFTHTKKPATVTDMSTNQVLQAFDAYNMFKDGLGSYWDTTAIGQTEPEVDPEIEKAKAEAAEVDKKIEALGNITLEKGKDIKAAREAYDALSIKAKEFVNNLDALKTAETTYDALVVDDLILKIGTVEFTPESEAEIVAAENAYNKLTEESKAKVQNKDVLDKARARYDELVALDQKAAADAKAVDEKIAAIGTVTINSKAAIKEARKAYDALSAEAQKRVTKAEVLLAAEKEIVVVADITKKNVVLGAKTVKYTGKAQKPSVTIEGLEEGKDFTVQYKNNINKGTAKVTITAAGEYNGTVTKEFKITAAKLSGKVLLNSNFIAVNGIYKVRTTGNNITIKPVVKTKDGKVLTNKKDYEVSYKVVNKPGVYVINVTGKGNYEGNLKQTLVVTPKVVANAKVRLGAYNVDGYNDAYITWDKSSGADGYLIYSRRPGVTSEWSLMGTAKSTATSFLRKNLYSGYKYQFKVIPFVKYNNVNYRTTDGYRTLNLNTLKKVNTPKAVKSKGAAKVSWGKVDGRTGYQIAVTRKGKTSYFTTTNTYKSFTLKNVKTTYKVRAYKTVTKNGKSFKVYAPWSAARTYTLR